MTDPKAPAAKATPKQRGRPFAKGQSGNPKGRPEGSRSSIAIRVDELLEAEFEAITTALLGKAKEGDATALRMVMDRIAPARKSRPIQIELPSIRTLDGVTDASEAILAAVSNGTITPDEGQTLSVIVEGRRKVIETDDLAKRISDLEDRLPKRGQ
jgi:hypothetical protein